MDLHSYWLNIYWSWFVLFLGFPRFTNESKIPHGQRETNRSTASPGEQHRNAVPKVQVEADARSIHGSSDVCHRRFRIVLFIRKCCSGKVCKLLTLVPKADVLQFRNASGNQLRLWAEESSRTHYAGLWCCCLLYAALWMGQLHRLTFF